MFVGGGAREALRGAGWAVEEGSETIEMKGDERKGKKQGRAASGIARSGDGCLLLFGFVAAAAAAAIFVVVVLPLALLTNSRSRFRWLFSFVSRPFLLPSHFFALLYALLPPSAFLGGAHQHTPALTRQFKCRRGGDFSTYCGGIGCTFPPPHMRGQRFGRA